MTACNAHIHRVGFTAFRETDDYTSLAEETCCMKSLEQLLQFARAVIHGQQHQQTPFRTKAACAGEIRTSLAACAMCLEQGCKAAVHDKLQGVITFPA